MDNEKKETFRMRVKQSRAFFFSLIAVMVIWVASSMSDVKSYREDYAVEIVGIDTSRYAILECDSVLTFDIESNGFSAFNRSIAPHSPIKIDVKGVAMKGDTLIQIDIDKRMENIRRQLNLKGVSAMKNTERYLRIVLAQRESKRVAVEISKVRFSFDGMNGLCGTPIIKPDSVTMYGTRQSLDKIDHISAKPQTLSNISKTNRYAITLDDSWKKYSDLRCSHSAVSLYIPVSEYVEKSIRIPININSWDNIQRINLYPPTVALTVLVPQDSYADIRPDQFKAEVHYNENEDELPVTISRFPSHVRIKSVEPTEVKYIVIK